MINETCVDFFVQTLNLRTQQDISMSLIASLTTLNERQNNDERGDRSPSIRSILSPAISRTLRLQARSSNEISEDLTDEDRDFDEHASARDNYRFASQIIRARYARRNSFQVPIMEQRLSISTARRANSIAIQAPPPSQATLTVPAHRNSLQNITYAPVIDNQALTFAANSFAEFRGQTLLHLAARLGHDEILRVLISETSQTGALMNKKGQTPLLTAIEAGSTSTATLLMEADPRAIIASDNNGSSVFHYACEHCNEVVLHRAIALSKRLNSTSDRITVNDYLRSFVLEKVSSSLGSTSYNRTKFCGKNSVRYCH